MAIADRGQTSTIEVVRGLEGVPDISQAALDNPRIREVWSKDERQELDKLARRAERWGRPHGVKVTYRLECELEHCPDKKIKLTPLASAPGGAVLRCGCTDRIFARF